MLTADELNELDALWTILPWAAAGVSPSELPGADRGKTRRPQQSEAEMKAEWKRATKNWAGNKR